SAWSAGSAWMDDTTSCVGYAAEVAGPPELAAGASPHAVSATAATASEKARTPDLNTKNVLPVLSQHRGQERARPVVAWVVEHLGRRPGLDDPAAVQEHHRVGDLP